MKGVFLACKFKSGTDLEAHPNTCLLDGGVMVENLIMNSTLFKPLILVASHFNGLLNIHLHGPHIDPHKSELHMTHMLYGLAQNLYSSTDFTKEANRPSRNKNHFRISEFLAKTAAEVSLPTLK